MLNKITFIGAGELAESLLKGFLNKNLIRADRVWINNHSSIDRLNYLERVYHVHVTQDKPAALEQAEVVILAFRPGDTKEALISMKDFLQTDQLVLSLMVGVPSAYIVSVAGKNLPIVRVMPNTSASIGLSATGMAAGEFVSREQMDLAVKLFETVGTATVVRESDIDVIAGLSGSGPAYLYYLAEAMKEAGIREGISAEASAQLVLQTLNGAVALLNRSGKTAGDLLKAVATPGGTTQAGIDTLNRYQTREAIIECVHQAIARAGEMSRPFSK
ncbi:pyrroline-5-carboxylate reductase [Sporolactobacillus sp. CQH2019]|uniref:pyrroline-5-carboxylate reductase n=1 Tax=Sporolactobacillus sp. CQH2019 TaxID=3023512 RepID=UPI0023686BAD|nr:pyrroline-5-carboxylate reductase [Sporolactobacillus sp. CQH2019]MDD9150359.1 pyrroline-5-carboxylate reductase [Sporolactobacillus sp. CQH2019]